MGGEYYFTGAKSFFEEKVVEGENDWFPRKAATLIELHSLERKRGTKKSRARKVK